MASSSTDIDPDTSPIGIIKSTKEISQDDIIIAHGTDQHIDAPPLNLIATQGLWVLLALEKAM
jgi:hypothetical protein